MTRLLLILAISTLMACASHQVPAEVTCAENACDKMPDGHPVAFETVEGLGEAIVAAVASGTPARLEALLLTEAEATAMYTAKGLPSADIDTHIEQLRTARTELSRRWHDLVEAAETLHVTLADLRFAGVEPYATIDEGGVTRVADDLQILLHVGDRDDLVLDIESCVLTPAGWRLDDPEVELEVRVAAEPLQ
jgi:hypothetical protein